MDLAQRKAGARQLNKKRKELFTEPMQRRVKKLLKRGFSPEHIAGRERFEKRSIVSHETIYQWIWEDKRKSGDIHTITADNGKNLQNTRK